MFDIGQRNYQTRYSQNAGFVADLLESLYKSLSHELSSRQLNSLPNRTIIFMIGIDVVELRCRKYK